MTMESRKEKVLEIANRAGFVVDIVGHGDRNADLHYKLDRFAELIVKECAGVAEVNMPITSHPDDRLIVKNSVLKHFGVE